MRKIIVLIVLLLCIINLSYLFYLFTVDNVILKYHTNVIEEASYDLIIQGLINKEQYNKLTDDANIKYLAGTFIVRADIINDLNKEKAYSFNFTDNINSFSNLLFDSEKYLIKGGFEKNKVVLTKDIANRYNFKIDDNIIIEIDGKKYYLPISGILNTNLKFNNTIIADYDIIDTIDNNILFTQVYIQFNEASSLKDVNGNYLHEMLPQNSFSFISKYDEIQYSKSYVNTIISAFKGRKIVFTITLTFLLYIFFYILLKGNRKPWVFLISTMISSLILVTIIYFVTLDILINPIKLMFM